MADYIPIPDDEIQPGKPGTSNLFHKMRDNPLAIAENAPGSPSIDGRGLLDLSISPGKLAQSFGVVAIDLASTLSVHYLQPGGQNAFNYHVDMNFVAGRSTTAIAVKSEGSRNGYYFSNQAETGTTGTYNVSWGYFADTTTERLGWLYILRDKSDNVLSRWFSQDYPAYGQRAMIHQPFGHYDDVIHNLYVIPIEKTEMDAILYNRIPLVGGGYLSESVFLSGTYDVDYFVQEQGFFQSLDSLFVVDYETPVAWPTSPILIGMSNPILGIAKSILKELPQPSDISCVGLSPI